MSPTKLISDMNGYRRKDAEMYEFGIGI